MERNTCGGAGCGSCCHHCGSCGQQDSLYLTPSELEILQQLAVTPFLPAGFNSRGKHPICLDCPGERESVSDTLLTLRQKRLISLDPEIPLQDFDYSAYGACPLHGSLALTALGQQVVELLEVQGAEE